MWAAIGRAAATVGEAIVKKGPEVAKAGGEVIKKNPGEVAPPVWGRWSSRPWGRKARWPGRRRLQEAAGGGGVAVDGAEWGVLQWGLVATAAAGYKTYRWWKGL